MFARWPARLRRLMPSLVLALWLAPQLLLATHGHWMPHNAAAECEICLQLATSMPALDGVVGLPSTVWTAVVVGSFEGMSVIHRHSDIACRGPPEFPASPVI